MRYIAWLLYTGLHIIIRNKEKNFIELYFADNIYRKLQIIWNKVVRNAMEWTLGYFMPMMFALLTNTENVEGKSLRYRLVDKLIRKAVKSDMSWKRQLPQISL